MRAQSDQHPDATQPEAVAQPGGPLRRVLAGAAHICAVAAIVCACVGLAALALATVYWFIAFNWVENLSTGEGLLVEDIAGNGVVFGSALGIAFSGSAVLLARFTGERKSEARRAVKMVALLLAACLAFAVAFMAKWVIDYR